MEALEHQVTALSEQDRRTRIRLHGLEAFAQAYLDTQKEHRRAEQRQYRRLTSAISIAGLSVSIALLILTAVTLHYHV